MIPITIVCWSCGKKVHGGVEHLPHFAFEVAGYASDLGFLGVLDMEHHRALCFCSEKCSKDQKLKNGSYRIRAKKVSKEVA
jgi:hypothetical protein